MGRLRRSTLLAGALLAWALVAAALARGAIPVAPSDGAKVNGTPTLAWGPGPEEDATQIELSPDRTLAEDGSFADDPRKRRALLEDSQTSYTVPASDPLTAGTWYWHVEVMNFEFDPCCSRWTEVRRIVVEDAPIRLASFKLGYLGGIDQIIMRIVYADNSPDLGARYRVVFRKRRKGRTLVAVRGRLDRGDFEGGRATASVRRPKRLRRGKRYLARLELRDAAGHVARSHHVRIRF